VTETPEIFKNTHEVAKYLRRAGWKVGRQKVYDDVKDGLLSGGTVTIEEVEKYAKRARLKRVAEVSGGHLDRIAMKRSEAEYKLLQTKIQRMQIEIAEKQGDLVPAIESDQKIAGVIAVIKHKLLHMAQIRSAEILEVGVKKGQQALADILTEYILAELDEIGRQEELEVVSIAASA
jgi:hypothetical protein